MPTKLKVHILEDNAADAELVLHELRRAGFDPEWKRTETEPDFLNQLDQGWEIILADYGLPEFGGLRALQLLRGRDPDLPFIIVSGSIGEDTAVAAIKAGANDYVMKHELSRLGPIVQRELRDARERRERKRIAEALRLSEERYRIVSRLSTDFAYSCVRPGEDGYRMDWITDAFYILSGYSAAELQKNGCWLFVAHPDDAETAARPLRELKPGESDSREFRIVTKDGRVLTIVNHMECRADPLAPGGMRWTGGAQDITKRKLAEDTLAKSEKRFRQLADLLPQIVFETNIRGEITFANQYGLKSMGYTSADLASGLNLFTMAPPEDREATQGRLREILNGSEANSREYQLIRKDGSRLSVLLHAIAILEDGVPTGLRGIAVDITARKKSEEELRKSEERFKLIYEYAPDAYYLSDLKGNFLDGNKAAEKITGYNKAELIGGSFLTLKLLSLGQLPKAAKLLLNNALGKSTGPDEFILKNKSGEVVHVEISTYPLKLEGKAVVLGIARDITERRLAARSLKESEERYRLLMEALPDAVVVHSQGRVVYANAASAKLIGFAGPAELQGRPVIEFVHPDSREMAMDRIRTSFSTGVPAPAAEEKFLRLDGTAIDVQVAAVPFSFEDQPAMMTVATDISERTRARQELQEAKALVETIVEHIPLMIFLKEATDLKFVIFNRAGEELLGYDRRALLGKSDLNLFPPEQAAHFMAKDREALAGHGMVDIPEESIQTAQRGVRLLHTRKVGLLGNDGTAKYLLGISEDITESKKAADVLQETLLGLRKALGGIIQVLASVSEIRDPYTAGHQRRVADLAQAIAQEMGLSPDRVEGIRVAGLIHDIGKMSIPAEILSKPAVLSKIEYALIQSHAQIGHDILGAIEFAWPLAEMIFQHHERMDGSGYPRHLKGAEILLEARILAVADVLEAMASHRPYRPSLGIEPALREIDKGKGVLYDPDVVAACLRLFREKGYALKD